MNKYTFPRIVLVLCIGIIAFVVFKGIGAHRHNAAMKFKLCSESGVCFYGDQVKTQADEACISTDAALVCGSYYLIVQHK